MTDSVTLEEVWRLFKATDERMARMSAEADRRHAETEAAMARRHAETEAAMARSRAETEAAMARSRAETEAAMARSRAETEAAFRTLSRQLGDVSNRLGEFVEDMVVPAAKRLFLDRGIPVHQVSRNTEGSCGDYATEFDILVVNADHVLAVEVKSRPRVSDVDDHLDRLDHFKRLFPRYGDCQVHGAIAGLAVDPDVARYAYRQGLFVLGQSGGTVVILNDDKFRPKVW